MFNSPTFCSDEIATYLEGVHVVDTDLVVGVASATDEAAPVGLIASPEQVKADVEAGLGQGHRLLNSI